MEESIQLIDGTTLDVVYQVNDPDEVFGPPYPEVEILEVYDTEGGTQCLYSVLSQDVIKELENELQEGLPYNALEAQA